MLADFPEDQACARGEAFGDVTEPGGLVPHVHLDVHGERGIEGRIGLEPGDVPRVEPDHVAQSGPIGEVACGVDVGRGDVDADHVVAGAAGDLACGSAESGADVQDDVTVREGKGGDEPFDRVRAADVELVEVVQGPVCRGVEIAMVAQESVDGLVEGGFSVGHRTRSSQGPVVSVDLDRWWTFQLADF